MMRLKLVIKKRQKGKQNCFSVISFCLHAVWFFIAEGKVGASQVCVVKVFVVNKNGRDEDPNYCWLLRIFLNVPFVFL